MDTLLGWGSQLAAENKDDWRLLLMDKAKYIKNKDILKCCWFAGMLERAWDLSTLREGILV